MEISDVTQTALGKAMRATLERHEALSSNIANANTPGYQRRDVAFEEALAGAIQRGKGAVGDLEFTQHVDARGAVRPDGGTVDVDQESTLMAANRMHFEALQAVKSGRGAIFKIAAGIR